MSWRAISLAAVTGLLAGLAAQAPLSLAARPLDRVVSAQAVTGTIWGGELKAAQLGDWSLGAVRVGLDPLSLLTGSPRFRLKSDGPVLVEGGVAVLGATGVSGLAFTGPLPARLSQEAGLSGQIRLTDATALFRNGACRQADGSVQVENVRLTRAPGWTAPALSGRLACVEGAAEARMQGSVEGVEMLLVARIQPDAPITLQTTVKTPVADVGAALLASGFAASPDGFVRSDQVTM